MLKSKMLKIFALKHCTRLDSLLFRKILSFLDEHEQEKILKFRWWQDAERSLLGNLIIRATICDMFQVKNSEFEVVRNEMGKPYINNMPQASFNISHSGHWIVGAFDSFPVGIDIEQIKASHFDMGKSIIAPNDYAEMLKIEAPNQLNYFFKCWTRGESYQKMLGSGVTLPLPSINNLQDAAFFKDYSIDEEYMLSICSGQGVFPECIAFTDIDRLLTLIKQDGIMVKEPMGGFHA
jgi:4'-phosphopantetheinyl transferase